MGTYLIVEPERSAQWSPKSSPTGARRAAPLSRGTGPEHSLIERVTGDASTQRRDAPRDGHGRGIQLRQSPYHRWPTDWPPIANALLAAAEISGSKLVTLNNLYATDVRPGR